MLDRLNHLIAALGTPAPAVPPERDVLIAEALQIRDRVTALHRRAQEHVHDKLEHEVVRVAALTDQSDAELERLLQIKTELGGRWH